jgi:hypothetical protein
MLPISSGTFLSGIFVKVGQPILLPEAIYGVTEVEYVWTTLKYVKACCVFPDVDKIYGGERAMASHCAVLLCDAELRATPLGRTFIALFQRVLERAVRREFQTEFSSQAVEKYTAHLEKTNVYQAELFADSLGDYWPEYDVCLEDWLPAVSQYIACRGYADGDADRTEVQIEELMSSIDLLPLDDFLDGVASVHDEGVLFWLRYGKSPE